jgi:DNA topoisomerase-1
MAKVVEDTHEQHDVEALAKGAHVIDRELAVFDVGVQYRRREAGLAEIGLVPVDAQHARRDVWQLRVSDRRIARIVRDIQDLPGQDFFQYLDEGGQVRDVTSADVNGFIRAIAGEQASAKDFRTWNGTVMAARALSAAGPFTSKREGASRVRSALHEVAERLGNSIAVCRSSYVHPAIIEGYLAGRPCEIVGGAPAGMDGLSAEEKAVLRYLEASC